MILVFCTQSIPGLATLMVNGKGSDNSQSFKVEAGTEINLSWLETGSESCTISGQSCLVDSNQCEAVPQWSWKGKSGTATIDAIQDEKKLEFVEYCQSITRFYHVYIARLPGLSGNQWEVMPAPRDGNSKVLKATFVDRARNEMCFVYPKYIVLTKESKYDDYLGAGTLVAMKRESNGPPSSKECLLDKARLKYQKTYSDFYGFVGVFGKYLVEYRNYEHDTNSILDLETGNPASSVLWPPREYNSKSIVGDIEVNPIEISAPPRCPPKKIFVKTWSLDLNSGELIFENKIRCK